MWFSPQPPADQGPEVAALFDAANVASAPSTVRRGNAQAHDAAGSGLIDVRTIVAAAKNPSGPATVAPPFALPPTLLTPTTAVPAAIEEPQPASRGMLFAIAGVLGVLLVVLAVVALG